MNDYKLFPTFLVVFSLLIPIVIAGPLGEDTKTIGSAGTGGVTGPTTSLKSDGSSCSAASECTNNYCVHSICRSTSTYCGDSYCDSGESCTSDCGTGGGVSTTGGVGGISTITSESKAISSIAAGSSETVTIVKADELKVEKVQIIAKSAVSSAEVTVKESNLGSLPSGTSAPVTSDKGAVLKYLEVSKSNIPDASVDKIKIEFRVEKTWVTSNNIATSTIALQRLVGTTWNKLSTTLKEETTTLYRFEAESPGLSYFAIMGEKKAAVQEACPAAFGCCVGEVNYTDKACSSGYECKNNVCVAINVTCPSCPLPSSWSVCVDEKQTRTNYRCSSATNYVCESYTEEQTCEVPSEEEKPTNWTLWIIIGVVAIAVVFALIKIKLGLLKLPKR